MTRNEFLMLCNLHTVTPEIALEHDALRAALRERDDAEVKRILTEEF